MTDIPEAERRKDVNTRKVIEVLTAKMDEKVKSVVTWEKLIFILGSAGVVIVSAAYIAGGLASSRAEARSAANEIGLVQLRKDTGEAVQLVREELKDTRGDIRSLYRSIRTNQPQPKLAAPVPELKPNPITADGGNTP